MTSLSKLTFVTIQISRLFYCVLNLYFFVNLSKFAPLKPLGSRDVAHKVDKSINTKSKSCDQAQQDEALIRFRRYYTSDHSMTFVKRGFDLFREFKYRDYMCKIHIDTYTCNQVTLRCTARNRHSNITCLKCIPSCYYSPTQQP